MSTTNQNSGVVMREGAHHTYEELKLKLEQMREVSSRFYSGAFLIGNHPFIEFCGLMNEYIKCCGEALEKGIDYTQCNTHSNIKLPMQLHEKQYINEKLECIFTGDFILQ